MQACARRSRQPLHPAQNAGPSPRRTCSPSCGWPIPRSRPTGHGSRSCVSVDRQKDQYETAIWIADSDGREPPRRLTAGPRDTAPRWSPDGTRLAFVRAAESDGRVQPPQIFVMPMNGGEGRAVTDIPAAPETRPGRLTDAPSPSRRLHVRRSSLPTRAQRRIRTNARVTCASSRKRDTGRTACREAATWTAIARLTSGRSPSATRVQAGGSKAPDLGEFGAANQQWSRRPGDLLHRGQTEGVALPWRFRSLRRAG